MKHFLIYTNKHKDSGLTVTEHIRQYLSAKGHRVTVVLKEEDWKEKNSESAMEMTKDADYMIVLGGDGTVLQAAREMGNGQIPLIGVNLGTLGYMTEIEPEAVEEALERLISGDYIKESRMMLQGEVLAGSTDVQKEWALNDIVITRSGSLQIIQFKIYVNGQFLHEYNADGVIVTTPIGSTGYNLSAGGPLVEPGAKLIMLTPICPHSLNQRSIILSPEDVIEIEISMGRNGREQTVEASFDGSRRIPLHTGNKIHIEKAKRSIDFLLLNQVSFLEILNKKMRE